MNMEETRRFVIEQAQQNIEFIKANPTLIGRAKQVNSSLANIVAMERNVIMNRALERAIRKDDQSMPRLPEPQPCPEGEILPEPVPFLLGENPEG
jgi:hypothetical protein